MRVTVTIGDAPRHLTTLARFLAANECPAEEGAAIRAALATSGVFVGGGGAAPTWTVARASTPLPERWPRHAMRWEKGPPRAMRAAFPPFRLTLAEVELRQKRAAAAALRRKHRAAGLAIPRLPPGRLAGSADAVARPRAMRGTPS
jgi:hypothetical protein